MTLSVDFRRPYEWTGPSAADADFIRQNGVIFGWSESNIRYEPAWWFDTSIIVTDLVRRLRQERPQPEAAAWQWERPGECGYADAVGVVIVARGPCPDWVWPILTVNDWAQSRATGLG